MERAQRSAEHAAREAHLRAALEARDNEIARNASYEQS